MGAAGEVEQCLDCDVGAEEGKRDRDELLAATFVSKITGVGLFEEPGRLRVQITGAVTPDEVLAEMVTSAPQLAIPES